MSNAAVSSLDLFTLLSDLIQLHRPRIIVLDTTFAHHSWEFEPQVRQTRLVFSFCNDLTLCHASHVLLLRLQIIWRPPQRMW